MAEPTQQPPSACGIHAIALIVHDDLDARVDAERAEPRGRAQLDSTRCVTAVVRGISVDAKLAQGASVDAWVYLRPSFKAAAY